MNIEEQMCDHCQCLAEVSAMVGGSIGDGQVWGFVRSRHPLKGLAMSLEGGFDVP